MPLFLGRPSVTQSYMRYYCALLWKENKVNTAADFEGCAVVVW